MTNHTSGLHHIGFAAVNFDKTLNLYKEGLGMTVKHVWGHEEKIYMLDIGDGSCIELFPSKGVAKLPNACWQHITLKTNDITKSFERAVKAGAVIEREPTLAQIPEAKPYPVTMWFANLRGFEGEEIEFIQEVEGQI